MKNIENISSISNANWLNLLPDLQQKKVLKIGTASIDIIKIISYCNVASLSCIGAPRDELKEIVNKFYLNEGDIGERFDVVIFDEVAAASISKISGFLYKIKGLLNDDGVMLVCCPDGWRNLKYRYFIRKALQAELKERLEHFMCNPSSARPQTIMPYTKNETWLISNYPNIEEKAFDVKRVFKEKIKESVYRIMGRYNPLNGLIVVLKKRGYIEGNEVEKETDPFVKICIAYPYTNKHYLFYFTKLDKKLSRLKKIEFSPSYYGSTLDREYKNLLLFKDRIDLYGDSRIIIPRAVYFNKLSDRHESAMTVVEGVSLKYLVDKNIYQKDNINVIDLLTHATDMLISFQKLTESSLKNVIYTMDPEYYLNYLGLELGDISIGSGSIQHCDLAANNIHFNSDTGKWGIIDWEGLTQGMSPMLDLFSMFTSFRFTVGEKKYKNFQEKYYDAIKDTYFSDNWISRCVMMNLKKYCSAFGLPEDNIYKYFVLFLMFQSNKYRLFSVYDYQFVFEKMLHYSSKNKDKFIV